MKKVMLLLLLVSCAYDPFGVRYVIDGDTFVLNNGDTIRLLGIDTPERGDANYDRTAYALQEKISGRNITLEGNTSDKYGRLLRNVYVDGRLVNLEMVREGLARKFMHENLPYKEELDLAQQEAQITKKGIWNIDDRQYQRLAGRCVSMGCPNGTIAVASKNGDVFYNCACSSAYVISPANMACFASLQEAIAEGLSETRRC